MPKVFILPKEEELKELDIQPGKTSSGTEDVQILFPHEVIVFADKVAGVPDGDETARSIAKKIEQLSAGDKEIYLLYHLGSALSIDAELRECLPCLYIARYSHNNDNYAAIKDCISNVDKAAQSAASVVQDFFFSKELEVRLALLQACLHTPRQEDIVALENIDLVKDVVIAHITDGKKVKQHVIEFISKHLAINKDCTGNEYRKKLNELRKALFPSQA